MGWVVHLNTGQFIGLAAMFVFWVFVVVGWLVGFVAEMAILFNTTHHCNWSQLLLQPRRQSPLPTRHREINEPPHCGIWWYVGLGKPYKDTTYPSVLTWGTMVFLEYMLLTFDNCRVGKQFLTILSSFVIAFGGDLSSISLHHARCPTHLG